MPEKTKPVLHGPWSHSRATSCALTLYKDKVLKAPPEPRPERLVGIDRRALGTLLHELADCQLNVFVKQQKPWLDARELSGWGVGAIDKVRRLTGKRQTETGAYGQLAPELDDIERRMKLFRERFRCDRDMDLAERDRRLRTAMFDNEMRLAVDEHFRPLPGDRGFNECPDTGWRGVVDYAEELEPGHILILDFKNRPAMYSEKELREHEQVAGMYPTLFLAHYPQFTRVSVGIYYLEFGVEQIIEVDRAVIDENFSRLQTQARHKESLTLAQIGPEPGFGKCQYCDYLASCPAGTTLVEPGMLVPTDMTSAVSVAKWLIVNEERVKAARASLRAFTAEHGAVQVDENTVVGYSVDEKTEWDKDKTLRALKALKLPLFDYVNLNKTELKKLLRDQNKAAVLAPATTKKMETDFEVFRARKKTAVKPATKDTSRRVSARVKSSARS